MVDQCSSSAATYWIPVLLAYKALYLLIGLMLAFQTYSVKIKELKDSKLIVISGAAIVIICMALTAVGFLTDNSPNVFYGLLASFILVLITGVIGLLTIPRVH